MLQTMWLPTRHLTLIAVVILIILLLLIGKVEGVEPKKPSGACQNSLAQIDTNGFTYVTGEGAPPLDPALCDAVVVARGKKVDGTKQCWQVVDKKWQKVDSTNCKSWTKIVEWKSGKVRKGASGTRPWKNVDGYKRKADKNFKTIADNKDLFETENTNTADCAAKCNNTPGCVGFVFRKSDNRCWGVNQKRVDSDFKGENGMFAFTKGSGKASSGGSNTNIGTPIQSPSEITANSNYRFVASYSSTFSHLAVADDACGNPSDKLSIVALNDENALNGNEYRYGTRWVLQKPYGANDSPGYHIVSFLTGCKDGFGGGFLSISNDGGLCRKEAYFTNDAKKKGNTIRGHVTGGGAPSTWEFEASGKKKTKEGKEAMTFKIVELACKTKRSPKYLVLDPTNDMWSPKTWIDEKGSATKFFLYKM